MILVIAYGNELREDDGAGLVLAERLEQAWRSRRQSVRRVASQQLLPEMASELIQEDVSTIVFVDTRLATSAFDRLVQITPINNVAGSPPSPSVGHNIAPDVLLAYAALLAEDRLPPAWLVTVPGRNFGFGEKLSEVAESAIQESIQPVIHALERARSAGPSGR